MILSENETQLIIETISPLLYHFHPNPNGADYRCEFCGEEPKAWTGNFSHRDDCEGIKILQILSREE